MVFITLVPVNKLVKYELKAKQIFLREKERKERNVLLTRFTFHNIRLICIWTQHVAKPKGDGSRSLSDLYIIEISA